MPLIDILDQILGALALGTKQPLSTFSKLETREDDHSLLAKDGSLVSILRLDGAKKVVGSKELQRIVDGASLSFAPYLESPGHAIQVWFSRDPGGASDDVKRALRKAERTAENLQLQLEDLFEERKRRLPNFLSSEKLYLALWTRPSVLTRAQAKENSRAETELLKGLPALRDAQKIRQVAESVRTRHHAFVRSMKSDLKDLGLLSDVLEVHDALRAVRGALYPELERSDWKPMLPGDRCAARLPDEQQLKDASELMWPALDRQIFVKNAEIVSATTARIGDYDYGSVDMTVGPEEPQSFAHLLNRMTQADIPWRIAFLLEGGGLKDQTFKQLLASILAWAAEDNKRIRNALRELKAAQLEGETVVKVRVSFATWAPAGEDRLLRERVSALLRGVEGWGHCQASDIAGDPLQGVMSSALGLAPASTAPAGAAPVADSVVWLPFGRPANPWKEGAVMLRTSDGKVWPYQPGSARQTTWVDLVFAPPGYGKSVLMNTVNLATCLAPSSSSGSRPQLPRVSIIDIGPSSSGLISLIKDALPVERRHEASYQRLQMTPKYAINPFDTQLGARSPLAGERAFLVNLLTLLATPVGERRPYDGITDLVGIVVDELYRIFSDDGQPRPYAQGDDPEVDRIIAKHNLHLPERPSWWEVVDLLADQELWHGASLAQRHAVPLLHDIVVAARSRAVEDLFGDTKAPTGENIVTAFSRMISGAIREYPILAAPTRFDIGNARVVALDLDEVAPRGGEAADRQTAVMYMLARQVLGRDFYLNQDNVKTFDDRYRLFHQARVRDLRESPKRMVYDEFHRTGASDAVRAQIRQDIREGRKWGVQICLASQLLEDFDDQMIDQATGIWVLGTGTESSIKEAVDRFGLSAASSFVLRHRLTGPGPMGAPLLAVLRLKDGLYEQYLLNTLGPIELWALSTTAEDAEIRNRLYARIGPTAARARLAENFPGGSAKDEIERRINEMIDDAGGADEEKLAGSVVDNIVEELVAIHRGIGRDDKGSGRGEGIDRAAE